MSSVVISGDTSGSLTLTVPAIAGTGTLTLPSGTGTVAVNGVSSNIVSGTAQNSTSGTSLLFTGVPSWAKRVAVIFNGVSMNNTNQPLVQIGSGSVTSTGYLSYTSVMDTAVASTSSTAGFIIYSNSSSALLYGVMMLTNISGNTWVCSGNMAIGSTARSTVFGGNVTLSGALDRVNITSVGGTQTFTAGSINIQWE